MVISLYVYNGYVGPRIRTEAIFLGLFFVTVTTLASWLYGRMLREDTKAIVSALENVSNGDFTGSLDTTRLDELGKISAGINSMSAGLLLRERIREAFGRFVSSEVAEEFIEKYARQGTEITLGGSRRYLTVLYCDIRNFTPLSESMDPEELAEMLNDYFTAMVSAVKNNGGIVDKFIGDAIMAVFGLAGKGCSELQAVEAALEIRKKLKLFNNRSSNGKVPEIDNGIGIHSGEMIAGYFGSRDRLEFTVIGSTVNMAARLESQAKKPNPPILFSSAVAKKVGEKFTIKKVGETDLKGISGKQEIYTLLDDNPI